MATTTNYGWTTPDDTALVKDGAAAIRTLGTSVDTTTKNLNPSTTLGDIEYRSSTANTNTRLGIGTSGQFLSVVAGVPAWANGFTNPLTTTGDTIYSSSGTTAAALAIGTTGQVLTVAGGLPSWATPSSPAFVGCFIHGSSTTISVANNTTTAMTLSSELYDTNAFHSTTVNTSRITIPSGQAGYYLCLGQVDYAPGSQVKLQAQIQKNGGGIAATAHDGAGGDFNSSVPVQGVFYLDVADYVELYARQLSGGALNAQLDNQTATYLSIAKIG